ncbi:MAG: ATP synthase F1 subunit delta [Deferribacterales bacterium]
MKDIVVSKRYALALYNFLKDSGEKEKVVSDFVKLYECFESSDDFVKIVKNPLIKKEEKLKAVEAISNYLGLSNIVTIFLKLLVEKNRLMLLEGIYKSLIELYNDESGIVDAEVVLAIDPTENIKESLSSVLVKLTGKKARLNIRRDDKIIGGFTAKVKSNLYDGSIKGQLEKLSEKMLEI